MPFAYLGAKHGLARYYPPPSQQTIIEPFAGAAGYSVFWATGHKVVLVDADPLVCELWDLLQGDDAIAVLDDAEHQLKTSESITNPFAYSIGGGLYRVKPGGTAKRSTMMVNMWPSVRARIEYALPLIKDWTIIEGDYHDLRSIEGTWFIDPPYQSLKAGFAGNRYGKKSHQIDYDELAKWSKDRPGQVIVCEQTPAQWLPFEPFRKHHTKFRVGDLQERTEVIWTSGPMVSDPEPMVREAVDRSWRRMDRYKPRGPYRKKR